jgi:ureidoglycolate lyase
MKLLRCGPKQAEKPALLDAENNVRDLSDVIGDINGDVLGEEVLARLRALDPHQLPLVTHERLGPCVGQVGKFVCVGLNYADHARETGKLQPEEPVLFLKAVSSISGPNDDVQIPRQSVKTDWEVELGVVIGKRAKYVAEEAALDHVAGYCVINDVSERSFQSERGGQWTKGKSHDTFGPVGPWLVTKDEIPDPQKLSLWLEVDGVRRQNGTTADMIFGVAYLVSYISQFMTLNPGDIIATGTPAGVGMGQRPTPIFLKPGQTIGLGIDGLGSQRQLTVIAGD